MVKRKNRRAVSEVAAPSRYQDWLDYVFNQPVTQYAWYFDFELVEFEASEVELAELIAYTLEHCARDLAQYSEGQIQNGINYIFNNSCSNVIYVLMHETVPLPLRLRAIDAIKVLYRDCFALRCAPVLSHRDEPGANLLNSICYMLWDVSPLGFLKDVPNREDCCNAVVDVLAEVLVSSHPACVESALHGLGHLHSSCTELVEKAVATYLRRNEFVLPSLQQYAKQAGAGRVQ